MSALVRASVRDTVLIAIAVVLLAIAAWRLSCAADELRGIPTDESGWVYFVCESCGAYFHLNSRESEEAIRSGDTAQTGRRGSITFRCKECGELKSVRAKKCPEHGVIIKLDPGPDDPAECPECGFRR